MGVRSPGHSNGEAPLAILHAALKLRGPGRRGRRLYQFMYSDASASGDGIRRTFLTPVITPKDTFSACRFSTACLVGWKRTGR